MFYTFHLWEISVSPQSVSLSEYQDALISYPYNLYRMLSLLRYLVFFSSRGPFGFVYLYLKGSTSPTDVSLPLCPDPRIYVWNSLLIYLCGPHPLPVSFYFFTFLILVLFTSNIHQYNSQTCTQFIFNE